MRILQVIPSLRVGGAERVAASLAQGLHRSGHTIRLVSLSPPSGSFLEARLAAEGVAVDFLGKRRGLDVRMLPRLTRAVLAFRPDLLHTHTQVLKYAFPAAAVRRCRVVHTVHNLAHREVDWPSLAFQQVAFRTNVVPVAIGEAVAESIRRFYRLKACRVVPNGVAVSDFGPLPPEARAELRRDLALPPDAPTFVAVGRFEPQKDHATLIRAFASARLRSTGAHLLLVGDGPLRGTLEQMSIALGAADRVRFLGRRSDVPHLLAASDVFVLSSRWEGNPLSIMEAMAAGKAVVATTVGCVPELVPDHAGILVPPGGVGALESAMLELARDVPRARALGAAAAAVARSRFDESVMVRAYEKLYAEVA